MRALGAGERAGGSGGELAGASRRTRDFIAYLPGPIWQAAGQARGDAQAADGGRGTLEPRRYGKCGGKLAGRSRRTREFIAYLYNEGKLH